MIIGYIMEKLRCDTETIAMAKLHQYIALTHNDVNDRDLRGNTSGSGSNIQPLQREALRS